MKHFIFDLGNVLIDFDLDIFYRRIQDACDRSIDEIESGYLSEKLEALEIGALAMDHFCKMYRFDWDLKWSPDDWVDNYAQCYRPNLQGQEWLARAKKAGFPVSVFSNLADFHKIGVDRTYPGFFEQFDHTFFSYQMGLVKPSEASYLRVCSSLSASPKDCVFIDDKPENIEGALNVGMKGIVFDPANFEQMESALFEFESQ